MLENKEIQKLQLKIKELEQEVNNLKIKPKYQKKEYKYLNEEKLSPPGYIPDKNEIELAKVRYVMENYVWTTIHYLEQYIDSLNGKELSFPYTKDVVENNAIKYLTRWNTSMEKWDDDNNMWDALIDDDWFQKYYVAALSDIHSGDCTAFACTCSRCQAETIFKLPSTANWGKHDGYRLYEEYYADYKSKNSTINNGE